MYVRTPTTQVLGATLYLVFPVIVIVLYGMLYPVALHRKRR